MQSELAMHLSKRCKARSKRTGQRCKGPAIKGRDLCRMHGARGGRPEKHGLYSKEAKTARKALNLFIAESKKLLDSVKK